MTPPGWREVLEQIDSAPDDWPGVPLSWLPLGLPVGEMIEAGVVEAVDAPDPLPRPYPATNAGRVRTFLRRREGRPADC